MKSIQSWKHQLRNWQREAFEAFSAKVEKKKKDFLCVATPGAGKTIFALRVAHYLLEREKIERIAIVCPTEHLKRQWAENAARMGLSIDPDFSNSKVRETRDFFGASLTYAQVGRAPKLHHNNCEWKKTLVIFDEIHHLGDNLSWGDNIRYAFENSEFRLAISGTPFRRDNNPIPFVKYKSSQSVSDYTYGYSNAIYDKVCRPVYFPAYEGEMEWRVNDKIYKATFEEILKKEEAADRLRTALDPKGEWLETVIIDADKKLDEIRKNGHPKAGGLLIAIDQKHARATAKLLHNLTGDNPVVVLSDEPQASKKIKKFETGSQKWLIAVKMVSEGVDIPRLRVGIYATNVKSELFFRQAVGRFVRSQKDLKEQSAYLYIPKDAVLVDYAKQIEEERDHRIDKIDYVENELIDFPLEKKEEEPADEENPFEAISSIATDKFQFELDFGKEFALPEEEIEKRNKKFKKEIINDKPEEPEEEPPIFEIIEKLKRDINDLSRRVAIKASKRNGGGKIDWYFAHKEWIKIGGKSIDMETRAELERRKKWLLNQI